MAMTRWLPLALALVLGSAVVVWAATTPEEVEENQSLQTNIVTPHKPWACGHVNGPMRALFFVFAGHYGGEWDEPGTRLREVIELGQRFDLQADAILYSRSGENWSFHGGRLGEDRARRLLARPYQLYVIAGFPMEKLPGDIQYAILERVVAGAGLVYCGDARSDYLTDRRRINPTPPALVAGLPRIENQVPADVMSAYQLRGGRAVWLKYGAWALTPNAPFTWRGLVDYDYRMLLVGRAALWATGKDSPIQIASVAGDGPLTISRTDAAPRAEVALTSTAVQPAQPARVELDLALRRPLDGATLPLEPRTATVTPGQQTIVAVPLPRLRAGEYYLDVIARAGGKVVACGAGNVVVESPYGVQSLTLDRTFIEPGETITGTVTLRGEPPAGSVLRLRLRDSYDRIVALQDLPVQAGQAQYSVQFTPDANATIELRAEALLLTGDEEIELQQAMFTVPKRRHGQFNFVQWDTPRDVLGLYQWEVLKRAGWQVSLVGSMGASATEQPSAVRAADVSVAPYCTRILDPKDENGYMKPVCWNNEPAVDEYVRGIVDRQAKLREQGVFVYSLGDEGVTMGCCVHPACIETYRRWLQEQYGTIEALNRSWGSNYTSFAEVDLLDRNDNMEAASRTSNPPRWYDRQAFARWNLSHFVSRFVKDFAQLDPHALTGYEGTGGFGDDYDAICGTNTFYGPYPSIGDDIVRSVFPRDRVRSNWMGYSKTGDALSDAAWRMVMKGMDSIWWWMWDGIGSYRGYVRPTMDLWPATEDVTREMLPVRRGLGDLIINSQVAHSGIAVFYSLPSALSGGVGQSGTFIRPQAVHEAWTEMTYELGLDFRYLTSRLLLDGELSTDEFRVLLLPFTQAISPEEADAIRRFAEAGGTVIADVRPGIFDHHLRALDTGALDDLFGITRTGSDAAVEQPLDLTVDVGGQHLDLHLSKVRVDPGVQAAGARALGQVAGSPVLLMNDFGRGHAVLLNFQLPPNREDEQQVSAARSLLAALYALGGAQAPVTITSPRGEPLPFTESRTWRNGDALIFGTYRKMRCAWFNPTSGTLAGEPVSARIRLAEPAHVYDLRAGKYLGQVSEIPATLRWGRANFYALLPYRLQGLKVSVSAQRPQPGTMITTKVQLDVPTASAARQAVWLQVVDPAGNEPLWGQRVVLLERGTGQAQFTVAHNDAPGQWRVRATELFSGQSAEASWTVGK